MTKTSWRALWWVLGVWAVIAMVGSAARSGAEGSSFETAFLGALLTGVLGAPVCFLILLFVFRVGAGVRRALVKQNTDARRPE
jgi:uncharacterized membrane protein